MEKPIPLASYREQKPDGLSRGLDSNYYAIPKNVKQKLGLNLIGEIIISLLIYYYYDSILIAHKLLGPSMLGASTSMLAQSINQFVRQKLNYNKVIKFLVWGAINGCFTALWLNLLFVRFDNILHRIILDQLIGAPIFQLIFTILNTLWDHGEIHPNTKNVYIRSLKFSLCFWPFFSILSFIFIPSSLLFPANCIANLVWSFILARLG